MIYKSCLNLFKKDFWTVLKAFDVWILKMMISLLSILFIFSPLGPGESQKCHLIQLFGKINF